jgi:hypothetical protein
MNFGGRSALPSRVRIREVGTRGASPDSSSATPRATVPSRIPAAR